MKKIFIGLVILIVVIVVGAMVALRVIDWGSYVANAVRDATGRELKVEDDVHFSLFPDIDALLTV